MNSNSSSNSQISNPFRNICLDVLRFDGLDPHAWIFATEQFFPFHTLPDEKHLLLISFHMDGPALTWFRWMSQTKRLSTWGSFLVDLLRRFGPSEYRDFKGECQRWRLQLSKMEAPIIKDGGFKYEGLKILSII